MSTLYGGGGAKFGEVEDKDVVSSPVVLNAMLERRRRCH